jgi:hypothetical protein
MKRRFLMMRMKKRNKEMMWRLRRTRAKRRRKK